MEAFSRAVDRTRPFGVLLIVTYRPEFEPPWTGRPNVTVLTLNRLGEREIAAMIDGVTDNKRLPESVRHDIIERTDGIPLFIEEITKAVLEAENEGATQRAVAAISTTLSSGPCKPARRVTRQERIGDFIHEGRMYRAVSTMRNSNFSAEAMLQP